MATSRPSKASKRRRQPSSDQQRKADIVDDAADNLVSLFVDHPASDEENNGDQEESPIDGEDGGGHEDENATGSDASDESSEYSDDDDEDEDEVEEEGSDNEDEDEEEKADEPVVGIGEEMASKPANDSALAKENGELASSSMPSYAVAADPKEYDFDSSDEEDVRNTVGNVPMEWYNDYPHIGYDWQGEKIIKPATANEIDKFLKRMDDPNFWKTVKDKLTGQDVVLSDQDLEIIQKLQLGKLTGSGEAYEPFEDIFSHEVMDTPLSSRAPSKRSFLPSLLEKDKVSKLVYAIKMGLIKPARDWKTPTDEAEEKEEQFYAIWTPEESIEDSKSARARKRNAISAPKIALPGHAESYNPPAEYLMTEKEKQRWRAEDREDRRLDFMPRQYKSLRLLPAWNRFIKDRFERCLDLYLCPRQRKMKVNVDPEDLIPKLPKPKDLQPFPTTEAVRYLGHSDIVRSISVHQDGQFLASGSDDCSARIWEVSTGRCYKTFVMPDPVVYVGWCPKRDLMLLAVAAGSSVYFLNPEVGNKLVSSNTDHLLDKVISSDVTNAITSFHKASPEERKQGFRITVRHSKKVANLTWHPKGDFFATIMGEGPAGMLIVHQLSKLTSDVPWKKLGTVTKVLFHDYVKTEKDEEEDPADKDPYKRVILVALQREVRIYNLKKLDTVSKKLEPNCNYVSCMAIHPKGDNVLVGSYDRRVSWFDLDSSNKPYQTMRHHSRGVRQVTFHKKYPLFASCSDDGSVIVSHGMVYNDLNQFPLIVPVKELKGHAHNVESGLNVLDVQFHPTQPWVFSAGADRTVRLYV
ncbi:hypothetical protein RvY_05878 [Ramazzottius varieornatus]|uniref:Ribosome biogenesis protein BOP1 homolog n=1 Tax=Ramazzottius varieornatus TaxID=947166 RepID=A0A1D1UZJ3_RAMVA|nr:hypothetical protein RvY_05878 [Ramazzottius varieornatus]